MSLAPPPGFTDEVPLNDLSTPAPSEQKQPYDPETGRSTLEHLLNTGASKEQIYAFVRTLNLDPATVPGLDHAIEARATYKGHIPVVLQKAEHNAPPAGFTEEVPLEAPAHSAMDSFNLGLTAVNNGLNAPLNMVGGAINAGVNALTGSDLSLEPFTDPITANPQAYGGPAPVTPQEKITSSAISGAASALPMLAATGGAGIVPELLAGAGSGAASESANQAGASPLVQIGAGILGGGLAGLSGGSAQRAIEGLGQPKVASPVMQAFDRQQIPALPADVGGHATKMLSAGTSKLTLGGIPLEAAAKKSIEAARAARTRIANNIGAPTTELGAGQASQRGANSAIASMRTKEEALHEAVPIEPDTPSVLNNTRPALIELTKGLESNPELSKIWADNARLKRTLETLTPKETAATRRAEISDAGQALTEAEDSLNAAKNSYTSLREANKAGGLRLPPEGSIREAQSAIDSASQKFNSAQSKYDDLISKMSNPIKDGSLSWQDMKSFRSIIGKIIDRPSLATDGRTDAALRKLYGALSQDMRLTAQKSSPKALAAFERANTYTRAMHDRIDNVLTPILGKDLNKSGEGAFSQIMTWASGKDFAKTAQLLRSLPEDEAATVRATIFNKMGDATAANQNGTENAFSPTKFATDWHKIPEKTRAALFPDARYRQDISDLVTATDAQKTAAKLGTGSPTAHLLQAGHVAGRVATFFTNPLVALADIGGEISMGHLLSSPRFARWLATSRNKPNPSAQLAHINRLTAIAAAQPAIANDLLTLQEKLAEQYTGVAQQGGAASAEQQGE